MVQQHLRLDERLAVGLQYQAGVGWDRSSGDFLGIQLQELLMGRVPAVPTGCRAEGIEANLGHALLVVDLVHKDHVIFDSIGLEFELPNVQQLHLQSHRSGRRCFDAQTPALCSVINLVRDLERASRHHFVAACRKVCLDIAQALRDDVLLQGVRDQWDRVRDWPLKDPGLRWQLRTLESGLQRSTCVLQLPVSCVGPFIKTSTARHEISAQPVS